MQQLLTGLADAAPPPFSGCPSIGPKNYLSKVHTSSCPVSAPEISAGLPIAFGKSYPSQNGIQGPTCPNLGSPLELMSYCVPLAGSLQPSAPGLGVSLLFYQIIVYCHHH